MGALHKRALSKMVLDSARYICRDMQKLGFIFRCERNWQF